MSAFFYDPNYFVMTRTEEPEWFFKVFGGTGWITGKWAGSKSGEDLASISFESEKWGKTTKRFEVFVLPYDEAKKLHKDLPEVKPNDIWGWAGFVPQSDPVGGDQ